jgi:hypothetical protein
MMPYPQHTHSSICLIVLLFNNIIHNSDDKASQVIAMTRLSWWLSIQVLTGTHIILDSSGEPLNYRLVAVAEFSCYASVHIGVNARNYGSQLMYKRL